MLQADGIALKDAYLCLNPFEVREVLQGHAVNNASGALRLNPFEVREVLQAEADP